MFAGAVDDRPLVASPWTPPSWTADAAGHVLPEFVWAVLDCPTYFALYMEGELPLSVLARLTARIDAPGRGRRGAGGDRLAALRATAGSVTRDPR